MHLLAALMLILAALPARGGTIHVAHDHAEPAFEHDEGRCGTAGGGGLVGYVGTRAVCAEALVSALRDAQGMDSGAIDEVVLLTSRPAERTLYEVGADRRPILPLSSLARPADRPLIIRGQRDAGGAHLVWLKGLDLIDTVCDPARVRDVADCRAGRPAEEGDTPGWERRYETTSLALAEEARLARMNGRDLAPYGGVASGNLRHYCVRLRGVAGLVLEDLAFEDCWLPAVLAVDSQRITLRGARIHGSTMGVLALATRGMSAHVHGFEVTDTHWIQSPGAYRPAADCAAPHLDLSCPVDLWDEVPWGVSHHHLWRPFNGGLFVSYNIAGNVLFAGNTIERAFNGLRMISDLPGTGRNVTVEGNRFRFVRDNAVEPEGRAEGWVIKHNSFENVHAWISTDGVRGHGFHVFGNDARYDPEAMPGTRCSDEVDWAASPFFLGLAGNDGRYLRLDISADPSAVTCRGHYRGTILKTGDKRKSGFPYLDAISIFHNSWRTRSPLWGNKHASPLLHFNNLIAFTGCGLDGPWDCRQIPTPPQFCKEGNKRTRGRVALGQYWTRDGRALVADCVSLLPGPAEPDDRAAGTRDVAHLFCRDVVNRPFDVPGYADGPCAPVFDASAFAAEPAPFPRLSRPVAGCGVRIEGDRAIPDCTRPGFPVGAFLADGARFDMPVEGAGYLGEAFRP